LPFHLVYFSNTQKTFFPPWFSPFLFKIIPYIHENKKPHFWG
jgi:hypothetical protein